MGIVSEGFVGIFRNTHCAGKVLYLYFKKCKMFISQRGGRALLSDGNTKDVTNILYMLCVLYHICEFHFCMWSFFSDVFLIICNFQIYQNCIIAYNYIMWWHWKHKITRWIKWFKVLKWVEGRGGKPVRKHWFWWVGLGGVQRYKKFGHSVTDRQNWKHFAQIAKIYWYNIYVLCERG